MNEIRVGVFTAQPVGQKKVPNLLIHTLGNFPEVDSTRDSRQLHVYQARKIAEALIKTLPGGTLHALLIEMLKHRENVLTVREVPDEP